MDFGGKMLKMQEKYAQKANKAQELKEKLKQKPNIKYIQWLQKLNQDILKQIIINNYKNKDWE